MFPDEESAVAWFESVRWKDGRFCPHCGSVRTAEAKKPQPYRCKDCRKHFSCRTGTIVQSAKLMVKKWLYAMYLMSVSRKGVSSLQLGRELGIAQEAAWRLGHKIRTAWNQGGLFAMTGPVEADETYIGGKEKNKHAKKKLKARRGPVGKKPVAGVPYRATNHVSAQVIDNTDAKTLQGFVKDRTAKDAIVYTDDARAYKGIKRQHKAVSHSAGEYVRDDVSTNSMESFWAVCKRGYVGTFHYMSEKHLQRYVDEFQARNNMSRACLGSGASHGLLGPGAWDFGTGKERRAPIQDPLPDRRGLHRDFMAPAFNYIQCAIGPPCHPVAHAFDIDDRLADTNKCQVALARAERIGHSLRPGPRVPSSS